MRIMRLVFLSVVTPLAFTCFWFSADSLLSGEGHYRHSRP